MELERIHFIAGLPRSGSTLLAALLRQNPRFRAQMSSPLEHIYTSTLTSMSGQNNFARFLTNDQRKRILRSMFNAYYADLPSNTLVCDTNRNWPSKIHSLVELFPSAKFICCVRNLSSIVNSFENLVAANPFTVSRLFGWDAKVTVFGRFERLMHADGPVGRALAAFKEGWSTTHQDRFFIMEYDDLINSPEATLRSLYHALGEEYFDHDFEHITYEADEFDDRLDLPGMHTVRNTISARTLPMLLPEDIVKRLENAEFWRQKRGWIT